MQASVPPRDPTALVARFLAAASAAGFRVERFGEIAGCPLLALTKRTAGLKPRIYLSAGIHGDEPASSLAALELLESGVFDDRAVWFLCPLLNPEGLRRGIRENPTGIDLNRDYRQPQAPESAAHVAWLRRQPNFDLSVCLHEDWESTGFYLYELNSGPTLTPAETILERTSAFLPIEPSALVDGREAIKGIIRPVIDATIRENWPESIYLRSEHHSPLHYTFETPSRSPLELRVAALKAAALAVIEPLLNSDCRPGRRPG